MDASTCAHCGGSLPTDAHFCPGCGRGVATGARPGEPPPWRDLARFVPPAVAERMREAGGHLEGERRPVTVMFADLSGFTALSERLDPEDVVEITNACLSALVDVVHAHDGSVDKFIGDEIMALFGAPIAHEDDALRAITAAFEMKVALDVFNTRFAARLPKPLALHFGVHSGEVVAGSVGHDERMNWSVMGDTVNLAARLADASEGGQVFCSARTRALTRGAVAYVARPALNAKGKARPVEVWDAVGALVAPVLQADGPLIGRGAELAALQEVWATGRRGRAAPMLVTGDAGVGKSRLLAALAASVDGRVFAVRAGAHPAPWGALTALTRVVMGGTAEDDDPTALDHLARSLARIPAALHGAAHAACGLEVPDGEVVGGARRGEAFVALVLARTGALLVVEDLHQADEGSRALLLELARAWSVPNVVLVASWRTTEAPAPDGIAALALGPLPPSEAARLADDEVPLPLPPEVHAFVAARAAGNPLYVRQLVRGLLESGALAETGEGWRVHLDGVGAVASSGAAGPILARVDRLPHRTREVLRLASVLGVDLPSELLARLAPRDPGEEVERLCAAGFLVRRADGGWFDLAFAHAMIREVTVASLLREQRRKHHGSAVAAIDALVPDAAERCPAFLLAHLEGAGEWGRAEAVAKAVVARVRRAAGEVPEGLARRAQDVGRAAADERQPWSELALNVGSLVSTVASVVFLVALFGVLFDAAAVGIALVSIGGLSLPSMYSAAPWWGLRSVAVDEDGIVVRRKLGRPVQVRWSDLREVRWDRNNTAARQVLALLRPQWIGRTGGAWEQLRGLVLHHGHTLTIEARDGRRVRLTTTEDRPLFLSITDVLADRARRNEPPVAISGSFGPHEAVRRTWVRTAAGEDKGAVSFEELVARVERGELGPADRIARAVPGERDWVTLEVAAKVDPKLAAALDPLRVSRTPNASHVYALALALLLPAVLISIWRELWIGVFAIGAATGVPVLAGLQSGLLAVGIAEWTRRRGVRSVVRRAVFGPAAVAIAVMGSCGYLAGMYPGIRAARTGSPAWMSPIPPAARPPLDAPPTLPYAEWRKLADPTLDRYAGTVGGFVLHSSAIVRAETDPDLAVRSATSEAAFAQHPRSWLFAVFLTRDACDAHRWDAAVVGVERLTWLGERLGDSRRACLALGLLERGDRDGALAALEVNGVRPGRAEWVVVGLAWARLRPDDLDGFAARYEPVPADGWRGLADGLQAEGHDPGPALARAGL